MVEQCLSESVTLHSPAAHVVVVTIDRPRALNAVDVPVKEGIAKALELTEADQDIWCVVLTGVGGKAFCAGADLEEVAAGRTMSLFTEEGGFAGFVHYPRCKPWIAAVDGFAVGGGCEIVLACDMVVASETSAFGLPETARGLIAGGGGAYRLPRVLPRNLAFELLATGKRLSAPRAHQLGMVNRLAPVNQVLQAAVELAQAVCECAPIAVRESLGVARLAADLDDAALRDRTREAMQVNDLSDDYQEGPRAFIEKRKPRWTGR